MSKPSYSPVCSLSEDAGGYAGSVETVSTPFSQISASRSVASVQGPSASAAADVEVSSAGSSVAVELSSPPQAANGTTSARSAAASSGRVRMWVSSGRTLRAI